IELVLDLKDVFVGAFVEVSFSCKILSDKSVLIFIASALLRAVRIGEVPVQAQRIGDMLMACELGSVIRGDGEYFSFVRCECYNKGCGNRSGLFVRQYSDEIEQCLSVGNGQQVSAFALNQVSFHISGSLLIIDFFGPLVNRDFILDNGARLLVEPSFTSFSVMPSEQLCVVDAVAILLVIDPQVDGFRRQHWDVPAAAGDSYLLR